MYNKNESVKQIKGTEGKLPRREIQRRCWIVGLILATIGTLVGVCYDAGISSEERVILGSLDEAVQALNDALIRYQDIEASQAAKVEKTMEAKEDSLKKIATLLNQAKTDSRDFKTANEWPTQEKTDASNQSKKDRARKVEDYRKLAEEERSKIAAPPVTPAAETSAPGPIEEQQSVSEQENILPQESSEQAAAAYASAASSDDEFTEDDLFADDIDTPDTGTEAVSTELFDSSGTEGASSSMESAFGDEDWEKHARTLGELLDKGDLSAAGEKLQAFCDLVGDLIATSKGQMKSKDAKTRYDSIKATYEQLSGEVSATLQRSPRSQNIENRVVALLAKADEYLAAFPDATYLEDVHVPIPEPKPVVLVPGEADFSIVTSQEMADSLVRNLVENWLTNYAGASQPVSPQTCENGWHYELQRNGEKQTVDVIVAASTGGAHVYISPQQNLQTAGNYSGDACRTICLDALLFMNAESSRPVMELNDIRKAKKYLMPEGTMDRVASDLFKFNYRSGDVQLTEASAQLPSDGLLAVTYHSRSLFGGNPVSIQYNKPRSCTPDAMSIASRHYLYTFDIVMETLKDDGKQLRESFESYFMGKQEASELISAHGYVPLYAGANLKPTLLTEQSLPVKQILSRLDKNTKAEFGYLDGRATVQGLLLPYPVRFPTDSDSETRCVLRDDDLALLRRMVSENLKELRKKYSKLLVVVTGHTDVRGDRNKKNMPLSRNRAARFLQNSLSADIAKDMITAPEKIDKNQDVAPYKGGDDVMVMSHGCSEDYYIVSEEEARTYGDNQETVDKMYQPDRRANIYVILPADVQ